MIKNEDIKVGLKFVVSFDNVFFTDISKSRKHVFTVKGFEVHDNEVYVLTDSRYAFTMKALLGASNRYQMFYADGVPVNESCDKNGDADRFEKITDEMLNVYKAKSHDYRLSFSNLFKECGMTYAYGHLAEKLERVKSLMKDEAKVKGEGMKDSLLDLANYAILTIMELDKTRK